MSKILENDFLAIVVVVVYWQIIHQKRYTHDNSKSGEKYSVQLNWPDHGWETYIIYNIYNTQYK